MAGFIKILLTGDAETEVEAAATLALTGDLTVTTAAKSATIRDLRFGPDVLLTVATGSVTATDSYHSIAGEGGVADQLDKIAGGVDGQLLILRASSDTVTITVAHNQSAGAGDNILLNADTNYAMDDIDDCLTLIFDAGLDTAGAWVELSRGAGNIATLSANAPANVGTAAAAGSGTAASKDDHVHDTATGFIDNANKFAAGVVDAAAIASNAVQASEIDETATDIAFSQIILTAKTTGTGTTAGTLYYDSDDSHPYIYQA